MSPPINTLWEQVDNLVNQNPGVVSFVGGVAEDWINKAESALSLEFSPSFRQYLTRYGGGTIGGEQVNGLLGIDFAEACGPDIVFNTLIERRQFGIPSQLVALVNNEGDEMFYLDTSVKDEFGENPVVREQIENIGERTPYANNFAEFLLKRIRFHLKGAKTGRQDDTLV